MARALDAIFFDIDDTLFSTTVFADKARRAAIDAMIHAGLRISRDACHKELTEVIEEFSTNHGNHFDKVIQRLPKKASETANSTSATGRTKAPTARPADQPSACSRKRHSKSA